MNAHILDSTLQSFVRNAKYMDNSFVTHVNFLELYVRIGPRTIFIKADRSIYLDRVLQIARITTKQPKTGAFRNLVEEIDHVGSGKLPIYLENLFNTDAAKGILASNLGFIEVDQSISPAPCLLRAALL